MFSWLCLLHFTKTAVNSCFCDLILKTYRFISNDRALQGLSKNVCGYTCSAGKKLLIVLANGDMMACRRLPFVINNIFNDSSIEAMIRRSPIMNRLAIPYIPPECASCKYSLQCQGGAKCVTYA